MTGILFLFINDHGGGQKLSEQFVNPHIKKVSPHCIDGIPNKVHSKGMVATDLWESIKQRFNVGNMEEKDFYNDKFGL